MHKIFFRIGLLGAALGLVACGGETLDGAALVQEKGCVACHGVDGKAVAMIYPNLNIQWEEYLRKQLIAYRSGERQNAIMGAQAMSLTDDEIRALAAHYGQ